MKKFIVIIITAAICLPAQAVCMIYDIQSHDRPVRVERPVKKSNNIQYGQIGSMKNRRYQKNFSKPAKCCAKPLPRHNAEYYKQISRQRMEERKLYMRRIPCEDIAKYQKPNPQISRFSKDYTIPVQKKISCGGVTYYNSPNPCK